MSGPETLKLLHHALTAHVDGRLEEAREAYEQVLAKEPDQSDALHLFGALLEESNEAEAGLALIEKSLALNDQRPEAWNAKGNALRALSRREEAVVAYDRAIALRKSYGEALSNKGMALLGLGREEEADKASAAACQSDPKSPLVLNCRGMVLQTLGRFEEALVFIGKSLAIDPQYVDGYLNFGQVKMMLNRNEEALQAYDAALSFGPERLEIQTRRAEALRALQNYDEAEAIYEQVLEQDVADLDAMSCLAIMLEESQRLDEAREVMDKGLALDPDHPGFRLVKARLLRREKDYEGAINALGGDFWTGVQMDRRAARLFELARIFDLTGQVESAFKAYEEANQLKKIIFDAANVKSDIYQNRMTTYANIFTPEWVDSWTPQAPYLVHKESTLQNEPAPPAFLFGFSRSGTTLLEQVFEAHPKVQTLDEQPISAALISTLARQRGDYPNCLATLCDQDQWDLREGYWKSVSSYLDRDPSCLLVDKMPLSSGEAGFLHRMFPGAKMMFALRHPCDVVLSNFMQNFRMNPAMASFTELETAAKVYDMVMRLWTQYEALLDVTVHYIRYEDLVADFEGSVGAALDFLGVGWDEAVSGYRDVHKSRRVRTPSRDQVTEKIYTRSAGRWVAYKEHLDPVLPVLEPWIKHWGYDLDQ